MGTLILNNADEQGQVEKMETVETVEEVGVRGRLA